MEAAVTLRCGTCMQTLAGLIHRAGMIRRAGSIHRAGDTGRRGGSAGPSAARRPQGPLPWSRRWAAVAAGVSPPASVEREEAAARRQADVGGRRVRSGVAEAIEVVARRELGRGLVHSRAHVRPVGDGHASGERGDGVVGARRLEHEGLRGGSAIRNEES